MSDMTTSDYAVLNSMNGANNWMNNPFFYLIFLSVFGNSGFGGFFGNNGGAAAAMNGALTRAELTEGFNNQNLQNDVKGVQSSIVQGFADTNFVANNNANRLDRDIHDLSSGTQMGFCSVNNSIGNLKYEMAQNCCELKGAIHQEGETTRALITSNQIQDLRDKLAEKDNKLQSANLTLANAQQTRNILDSIGRYVPYQGVGSNCPSPASAPACCW